MHPARHPSESSLHRRQAGSVLIITLLIMALIALGLGSYLTLNLSTSRLARQSYQRNAAFHLAEAGAEEALWSFNQANAQSATAWDGWTVQNPAAWRKFAGFDYGGNTTGSVKVYVSKVSPASGERPTIVAESTVASPDTPATTRMISVSLGRRSYFAAGLVARLSLTFSGLNTSVDSWNSDPDNDPSTPAVPYSPGVRTDHGTIGTLAVQNNSMLVNQASIWGSVATGGAAPQVGVQGSIRGANTPANVQIDPARVSTDFSANLPSVLAPVDGTVLAAVGSILGTPGVATKWRCNSLALHANQTLTIAGHVTLVLTATAGTALDVSGNAQIIIPAGSSLTLYVAGDVKLAGNGLSNGNASPGSCFIWGTGTAVGQGIQLAGNGALKSVVYAPNSDVKINGNGDIMGAVVANTITLTGNADFHYDEALANYGNDTPYGVSNWRELTNDADQARWRAVFTGW